ncbi:hypothetical protein UPYG_G00134630 [Umbra pygmaea]|uniref:Uncharacterized protein n=1 Tax=Umbra pygmaea TaxID=75934 RepID=A0ABD0XEN7_UMBPY
MEARFAVIQNTLAEFGCLSPSTAKVVQFGDDLLVCTGSDEVFVFNTKERKLTAVLHFLSPVVHVVQSLDKQHFFAVCEGDGIYCVDLPTLPSRPATPPSDQSPGPALFQVLSNSLAARDAGVCSMVEVQGASGDTLVTVSQRDAAWWFSLYTATGYRKLAEFSLPVVSGGHRTGDGGTGLVMRPVLACVSSRDAPSSSSSLVDCHFLMETLLFKLLFGVDASFVNSSVILCGLPDGRLCSFPLHLQGQPGPRVRVLHSLEQPITFVGTSTETNSGPQCLVAVGRWGRVVLARACEGGPGDGGKVAGFTEGCVSGPVLCACADGKGLYYSTGSDLLVLDLSGGAEENLSPGENLVVGHGERQGPGQAMEKPRVSGLLQSPVSLNVCRVIALSGPSCNTSGQVQLLALTLRGRLQVLTLPGDTEGGATARPPSSQVGQRVRDLLAAIGDVCDRASSLNSIIQSRNNSLRGLNQVLSVCCLLLANQRAGEHCSVSEKPIWCHIVAKWSRLLQKDSLILTCVLDNSSPYVLEQGWMLCVQVLPLSCPLFSGGENFSRTVSFPVQKLEPSGKMNVSLPLITERDMSFPVTVKCSLTYSLQSLLGTEELSGVLANGDLASCPGLEGGWFSLALNTQTVDWLDVLQVVTPPGSDPSRPCSNPDTVSMDTVKAFLSSRRRCDGYGDGMAASEGDLLSASIKVSTELLRTALSLEAPSSAVPQGPKNPTQGICGALLSWLLSKGSAGIDWRGSGVTAGQQGRAVVHARCPEGGIVKLTATEVTVGGTTVKEGTKAVEVQVQCSEMAALCGLHHALLCRVQPLLQGAAGTEESSIGAMGLGLRLALQRAQALYELLQEARIPNAIGPGRNTGRTTKTLFSVYRQLRENPLLIL